MVISSTKATILLGSLMTMSLPVPKVGSVPAPTGQAPQVKPKPVKVTGCLQKGDEENEFVITDKAGKKYEIASKSVALAGHVGHTVTVKGTILAEAKGEKEATEEKGEKGEKEATAEKGEQGEKEATAEKGEKGAKEEAKEYEGGHVQVTSLAMVSPKCQ
jgi:hypothetical protein